MTSAYLVLVYGVLIVVGGIIGYLKAASLVSLIVGGFTGLILIVASLAMFKEKVLGLFTALGLSAALTLFFGYRFSNSFKFMPAGLVGIMGLIVVITLLVKLNKS